MPQQPQDPRNVPAALAYADKLVAEAEHGNLKLVDPKHALELASNAANHLISLAIEVRRLQEFNGDIDPNAIDLEVARQPARFVTGAGAMAEKVGDIPFVMLGLEVPLEMSAPDAQRVREVFLLEVSTAEALEKLIGKAVKKARVGKVG